MDPIVEKAGMIVSQHISENKIKKWQEDAGETIARNKRILDKDPKAKTPDGKQLKLRYGVKNLETDDGRLLKIDKVTQWSAGTQNNPPTILELKRDASGKIIDTKADKQLPGKMLTDAFTKPVGKGGIKWPKWVPEEARTLEAYNKWNRGNLYIGKKGTKKYAELTGVPQEFGHAESNIGQNIAGGAQPKYGESGNQTTRQNHIVTQGETVKDLSLRYGVSEKEIIENNKGIVKKGIKAGDKLKITTLKGNLENIRSAAELAEVDLGSGNKDINQLKSLDEYIRQFDPEGQSKVISSNVRTASAEEVGEILHNPKYKTAESARFAMEEQARERIQSQEKAKLIKQKSPTGLEGINFKSKEFTGPNKMRNAKNVYRVIADRAGTSANPLANIAGDFAGVLMDGVAFAQNPKDKQALADLTLSGTQAAFSLGAIGLAALPIPGARPGAYLLLRAGDKVGQAERLLNIGREGFRKVQKGTLFTGAANVSRKVKVK
tara:strand:- start:57 stop:1532 length:1476 start_codon:yes stop_codon:yes gene_type:complete